MKKIIVNSNCIGCGACTSFCDVFKFNDEGLATTDENKNIIDNMECILQYLLSSRGSNERVCI